MGISIEKLENRKYTIYCHVFPNGKKYIIKAYKRGEEIKDDIN